MSRYVDADALVELIDYYILHDKDAKKNHSALFIEGMKDGYYRIRSNVIKMPTADVRENVHGKWILLKEKGDCIYKCSKCGFVRDAYILDEHSFCPNCGADMKEVKE